VLTLAAALGAPLAAQPILEWNELLHPWGEEGRPVAVRYAGDGGDFLATPERDFAFVAGDYVSGPERRVAVARYLAERDSGASPSFANVWPPLRLGASPTRARAMDMLIDLVPHPVPGYPTGQYHPIILAESENEDNVLDAVVVAFGEETDFLWNSWFPRPGAYHGDIKPIAIRAGHSDFIAALAQLTYDQGSTWAVAAFDAADGRPMFSRVLFDDIDLEVIPVGVDIGSPGIIVMGSTQDPATNNQVILLAGYDLEGNYAPAWDPTDSQNTHLWLTPDPDHHCVPASMRVATVGGPGSLAITGTTIDPEGVQRLFTASLDPAGYVRWVHEYDAGSEAVGVDVTTLGANSSAQSIGFSYVWSLGTRIDSTGRKDVVALQFDDNNPIPQPPPAYPLGRLDWRSHWDAENDGDDDGIRIAYAHWAEGPQGIRIFAAVSSMSEGPGPVREYAALKWDYAPTVPPGGHKDPAWLPPDIPRVPAPGDLNATAVGLDAAAFWTDDVPGTNRVLRFWLTGWYTMLDNSEYWMTPQFRDPNP
jgi:hypothetical protein